MFIWFLYLYIIIFFFIYYTGVPTSLDETGEQWDFPNAWAPLQSIIVNGLDKLGTDEAQEEAYRLADKWLQSNFKGYKESTVMYEKVITILIFFSSKFIFSKVKSLNNFFMFVGLCITTSR